MCLKSDFREIVLKLATIGQSDKGFQTVDINICPQGVVGPCLGAIYIYKSINPSHAVQDLSRMRQDLPCCCSRHLSSRHLSIPWGTQGTTRRRHANNVAREIDDFIGYEGDFPI